MSKIGAELTKTFNDAANHDLLTNWMARYLAEKLLREKEARGAEKAKLSEECAELVFKLWERRHTLPDGVRPFESFEPLFQTLQDLASTSPRNAYLRSTPRVKAPKDVADLLVLANDVDQAASTLIRYLLSAAVEKIPVNNKRWAKLRDDIRPRPWDLEIVYVLTSEASEQLDEKTKLKSAEIREIERMLAAVRKFERLVPAFVTHFERRLALTEKK